MSLLPHPRRFEVLSAAQLPWKPSSSPIREGSGETKKESQGNSVPVWWLRPAVDAKKPRPPRDFGALFAEQWQGLLGAVVPEAAYVPVL